MAGMQVFAEAMDSKFANRYVLKADKGLVYHPNVGFIKTIL